MCNEKTLTQAPVGLWMILEPTKVWTYKYFVVA